MQTEVQILKELNSLCETHLNDLYEMSIKAVAGNTELEGILKEERRRLDLAIARDLMDKPQTQLAFRVAVKNLIRKRQESTD